MNDDKQYITPERRKELEEELEEIKTVKRKEILEKLKFAKSLGDLSENTEYQSAREEQARVEDRINQIKNLLKTAVIVKKRSHTIAEIGSTVTVKKIGDKEKQTFLMVGSEEVDMSQSKISNESPLGKALLDKKKGDKLEVKTPGGIVKYSIIKIE